MKKTTAGLVFASLAMIGSLSSASTPKKALPVAGGQITEVKVSVEGDVMPGYRASYLLGLDVFNKGGEKIGKIDDFIVGRNEAVTFGVVSVGGFLGLGAKLVAIPATEFDIDPKKKRVTLATGTKNKLKALPTFEYGD